MERGLLWLPLLGVFVWLAWAGWNEYQKVQAYEVWAQRFERSKYDIRSMLGQTGYQLTWGRPTRQGPVDVETLSLGDVETLALKVDGTIVVSEAELPTKGQRIEIACVLGQGSTLSIPFTDIELANQWKKALQQSLQELKSAST